MVILCMKFNLKHLKYLKNNGHSLMYLCDEWDAKNMSFLEDESLFEKIFYVKSMDSIEGLTSIFEEIMNENIVVDKIINGAEYGVYAVGFLNTLKHRDVKYLNGATLSRNKKAMKNLFTKLNISCAKTYGPYTKKELTGMNIDLDKFPSVIKPIAGVGSFNTEVLYNNSDLKKYLEDLVFHPSLESELLLLEEYIEGEEFHADIIWKNGVPVFCSIGKYFVPRIQSKTPKLQHLNGSYLLPKEHYKELYDKIVSYQIQLNEHIKLENGVTHTEFFLKLNTIYLSEIATRYGGGAIPEMISAAYGINIEDEWLNSEIGFIDKNRLDNSIMKKNCAAINITPLKSGVIKKYPNINEIANIDWVESVDIKTPIGSIVSHKHPSEWCLLVVVSGEGEQDFIQKIKYLRDKYRVEVD